MAKLIYATVMSVDGYIGDEHYDWSVPTEGSTAFITQVMRPFKTCLYGRRNFETMSFWETADLSKMGEDDKKFAGMWQSCEKIIFSKTLKAVATKNSRIESEFDAQKIRKLKSNSPHDLCIGGPTLAAQAFHENIIDEVHLFVAPTTILGAFPTIPVFPSDRIIGLELIEVKRFGKGWVYLRYQVKVQAG